MEGKGRNHQVFHGQAREIISRVYEFFKSEAEAGEPLTDVARVQERTANACGVGVRSIQRIICEARKCVEYSSGRVQFKSPNINRNRKKPITDLDDFNKDFLKRIIFDMNVAGEFPTTDRLIVKMQEAAGFKGSRWSMLRILKGMGFKYVKCDDGRKMLIQVKCHHSDHQHGEGESVQSALNATKGSYQHALEHVNHMVPLVNEQTRAQVVTICNDETKKLAAELTKLASELDNKVKSGEHSDALKNAVHTAVTNLNTASANLNKLSGDDISAWNSGYFHAVESAIQEVQNIHSAGTCPEIDPVLIKGLHDVTHLFNEYQDKFHAVIGVHDSSSHSEGSKVHASGVHHHHHHHHQAHGAAGHQSSEESAESSESHGHGHSH